jgi:hypothetical protein
VGAQGDGRATPLARRTPIEQIVVADLGGDLGQDSIVAGAPSSWRPPWLEMTMPSAPASTARRASSAPMTPLTTNGPSQLARIHSMSSQVGEWERSVRPIAEIGNAPPPSTGRVLEISNGIPSRQ